MLLDTRSGKTRDPYTTLTELGWVLCEPTDGSSDLQIYSHCGNLDQQVANLWGMEAYDEDIHAMSQQEKSVVAFWEREMSFQDGHYVLPIPWKDERPNSPNNKSVAVKRLNSLMNRLQITGMVSTYGYTFQKLVTNGYVEPVPDNERNLEDGSVWYLPYHAVVSASKPGKVRNVFDYSANYKFQGASLNNQCWQGPDLNNKLLHVLLHFRQHTYAVMADVRAMYHQVHIPIPDRNALRLKNAEVPNDVTPFRWCVVCR